MRLAAYHLSTQFIAYLRSVADVDGSGEINWWEFCHMMQKIMDEESRELEEKRQVMIIGESLSQLFRLGHDVSNTALL